MSYQYENGRLKLVTHLFYLLVFIDIFGNTLMSLVPGLSFIASIMGLGTNVLELICFIIVANVYYNGALADLLKLFSIGFGVVFIALILFFGGMINV